MKCFMMFLFLWSRNRIEAYTTIIEGASARVPPTPIFYGDFPWNWARRSPEMRRLGHAVPESMQISGQQKKKDSVATAASSAPEKEPVALPHPQIWQLQEPLWHVSRV